MPVLIYMESAYRRADGTGVIRCEAMLPGDGQATISKVVRDTTARQMTREKLLLLAELLQNGVPDSNGERRKLRHVEILVYTTDQAFWDDLRIQADVRILCRTRNQANRAAEAVKLWLNERLCLQVSEEKTRVVNVKKHYTEFLGFKLRTERKKGKLVVQSHICDKAKGKIATMAKEQVKRIQRPVNSGEQVKEICKYNAMVRGWHNYYEIATQVSCDFAEITWQVSRAVQNRLKLVISKSGSMGKKRGIESVEDLLRCYPKEYRDYRVPVSVRTLKDRQDERAAVLGIVTGCRILQGKHAMVRLKDKDGGNISAVWFNQAFRVRQVVLGGSYIVGGMARWDEQYQSVSFLMPDLFESFEGFRFGIKPVYRKIPGMSEEYFSSVMEEALSHIDDMGDYLNDEECKALDVPNTADTFRLAHLPESMEDVRRAQRRVLVDNMYPFCREMEMKRMQAAAESPFVPLAAFETMEQIRTFLPYQLTEDQKNALRRMLHEMKTGKRLDVLLQGDVGCGKTIVAIILAACMSKSGYQTAVVCPTSVLAGQHLQAYMIASSAYGTLGAKSYADVQDADVPDAAANRQMPVKVVTTTASTAWVVYDSLGETFEVAVSHDAAILCVQESITFLRKTEQCYSRKDNNEYNAVKTAIQTDCDELPSITLYGKDNTTCEVIVVKRTIRKSPQEAQLPSGQAS